MSTKLYLASHFESHWQEIVGPWLSEHSKNSWRSPKPTVVLIPSQGYAFFLRSRLLELGLDYAGIFFWTPRECRSHLLSHFSDASPILNRENLHLLLAIAAEKNQRTPVSLAISKDPSQLMRCFEELSSSGWEWNQIINPLLTPTISALWDFIKKGKVQTLQQTDQWLMKKTKDHEPSIQSILLIGFDATHWPLWHLLNAIARSSTEATICLSLPRYRAENLDQVWINSWEENFGAANPIKEANDLSCRPFAYLAERMEAGFNSTSNQEEEKKERSNVTFLIAKNIREQVQAIVLQIMAFLAEQNCKRLGVLFPNRGALLRETTHLLGQLKIPHFNWIGYRAPQQESNETWKMWLQFQNQPHAEYFLLLLRVAPKILESIALPFKDIQKFIEAALNEMIVGDISVLRAFLENSTKEKERKLAGFLASFPLLPAEATFKEFLCCTEIAFQKLGLDEKWICISEDAKLLCMLDQTTFSKFIFLTWLRKAGSMHARERSEFAHHPYARVHLLTYSQAEHQEWSHLILAGLNEGEWPPSKDETVFLNSTTIDQLNQQALQKSLQDPSLFVVQPGKAICLGATQKRILIQRQFYNILESGSVGLCITASMQSELNPERPAIPSEFLTQLFWANNGTSSNHKDAGKPTLSEEKLSRFQEATTRWVQAYKKQLEARGSRLDEKVNSVSLEQTLTAYQARRNAAKPFGKYEFAFEIPLNKPIILTCKEWGEALSSSAPLWLKHVLGVETNCIEVLEDRWSLVTGTWTHRWLCDATKLQNEISPLAFPSKKIFLSTLKKQAHATRNAAATAFEGAHYLMPNWWSAGWHKACWISESLAKQLFTISDWPYICPEWTIPRHLKVSIDHEHSLILSGRIDALLAKSPPDTRNGWEGIELWILDYKTGNSQSISFNNLKKGEAIQLALYGLALSALGSNKISLSIVTPHSSLEKPAMLEDIRFFDDMWRGLCKMQNTGVFGMRGQLRSEFSFQYDYPLATLEIDPDILEQKWERTYPSLP